MSKRMVNPSTGHPRICLVTGSAAPGGRGIGRAMVNVFAREGAKVVVSDISAREKEGLQAVSELDAQYGPVRLLAWATLFLDPR